VSRDNLLPYELMQMAASFFDRRGIAYRIVGSMASMAYSEARFTNDIDILVDLREDHAEQIESEFPAPEFYVSLSAIKSAIRDRRQFNIIHIPSGLKLDIIQRKDNEFGTLDITRGQRLKSDGFYDAWFASPENVILMKLRYFQEGGSDKHLRDVASILLIQDKHIDREYIEQWARKLSVEHEWQLVIQQINVNRENSSPID
jgi:hypothetical protein